MSFLNKNISYENPWFTFKIQQQKQHNKEPQVPTMVGITIKNS